MVKGAVGANRYAMSTAVANVFAARHYFRKALSILLLDDHHRALANADAVLLALGFVDSQESHVLFFHLFLSSDKITGCAGFIMKPRKPFRSNRNQSSNHKVHHLDSGQEPIQHNPIHINKQIKFYVHPLSNGP